jgi:sugar/nucleoside kinase (ribokinase family)
MDIVSLGELLVDMFPAELGRRMAEVTAFHPKPGGAPANVAVAAARLGADAAFIGKVGEDAFGRHLAEVLKAQGVETRGMRFDTNARTTMAFIAKPDENTAEFVFYRNPGADTLLRPDELDRTLLQKTRVFHFGSLSLTEEPSRSATFEAAAVAGNAGALISFDVNYRPSLWNSRDQAVEQITAMIPHVHLLKVNEDELALLTATEDLNAGSAKLLAQGPELVVVTLGPDGSYFRVAEAGERIPPFAVEAVDAVGCGDAFIASVLCRLVRDGDWRDQLSPDLLRQHLRYANAVGALTALTEGVIPALPTASQVDRFLSEQGSAISQ